MTPSPVAGNEEPCRICGNRDPRTDELTGNPSVHDPAYHVAKAYHQGELTCDSCGQLWPCETIINFTNKEVG